MVEVHDSLLQRLLTRMDHLEFGLMERSRHDVQELKDSIGRFQKARRLEAEDSMVANALAYAPRAPPPGIGHRGPGSEYPMLPRPLPAGHREKHLPIRRRRDQLLQIKTHQHALESLATFW